MREILAHLVTGVASTIARIAGIAAGTLPKRWWPTLDSYVPVSDSASMAAIVTILAAGAIGIPGFIDHTSQQVSLNNRAILIAAQDQASRPASQETVNEGDWGRMIVNSSALSLLTFILLTPAGWASTYLGMSGMWRGIAAALDEPFGDPILTGIDTLILRSARQTQLRRARHRREALEGPETPDRVARGTHVDVAGADLVIICARRKPLWDKGTIVDTGARWFRVTSIEERTMGGRLRTLYGLTEHRDLEVFRRCVRYELPSHLEERAAVGKQT